MLGVVNFFYAYKNGTSLKFIGWGSTGLIWTLLIAWRLKGNLIDAWTNSLTTGSNDLWLLHALMYGLAWMIVAGIASFFAESVYIVVVELKGV